MFTAISEAHHTDPEGERFSVVAEGGEADLERLPPRLMRVVDVLGFVDADPVGYLFDGHHGFSSLHFASFFVVFID